nr:hypothetical protein [Acidobacteriota bacterium]NIQ86323.1 hypothetical protein [Acidobacteriota bacterium]
MNPMVRTRQTWVVPGLVLVLAACSETALQPPSGDGPFREVSGEAGLQFTHFNGMYGEFHLPEIVGSGLAWLDYDRDGDMDLYVVQGAMIDPSRSAQTAQPGWHGPGPPGDRLFRNDLAVDAAGARSVRFTDVTEAAGIPAGGYGMGVAAGDYDNDGWVDLYVTRLGENRFLRNTG